MSRLTAMTVILSLSFLAPACKKDEPKKEEKDKSAQVEAKPTKEKPKKRPRVAPLAPDEPRTKLGDIPVSAELEEEADRTVAIENLEAELDRLEAEIIGIPK